MAARKKTYSDLNLNFDAHPVTGDIVKRKDASAVIGSLSNLFNTHFYERLFRPEVGSNLNRMLFEPVDYMTTEQIKREIENVIRNYEPRASIDFTEVLALPDDHRYDVTISFYVLNSASPIQVNFFLERVR